LVASFSEKSKKMKSKYCRQKNLLRNKVMSYTLNNAAEFMCLHRACSASIS